jgi:hypothetical protein
MEAAGHLPKPRKMRIEIADTDAVPAGSTLGQTFFDDEPQPAQLGLYYSVSRLHRL